LCYVHKKNVCFVVARKGNKNVCIFA
jgi:hypothetical protein